MKPGKQLRKPEDVNKNYTTKLPHIGNKPTEYRPMPYTFRIESTLAPVKITKLMARSPPHYMLLDHTMAVVWLLFANKEYNGPLVLQPCYFLNSAIKLIKILVYK